MKSTHTKTTITSARSLGAAFLRLAAAFFILHSAFFIGAASRAQETPLANPGQGSIRGTVYSALTTEVLEGAEITLSPSGRRTNAARDGTFNFGNVPAGDARITVSYPGLTTQEITLSITSGRVSETAVTLKDEDDSVVHLQAFVVQGAKEGMSKAIAMQKASDDLRMIAAADQFGDHSGNLGDYLQFIPGVAPDGFDGRSVSLRGMAPFLTNLTLDGATVASASSGEMTRTTELETLSLSNVETIEVIKTLTPDQPATNTAGSINMITKSAFDQTASGIRYRAFLRVPGGDSLERFRGVGVGSGEEVTYIQPNLELDITKRLGKNLGIYIGARSYQNVNLSERGTWTYTFDPAEGGLPGDPAPTRWRLNDNRNKMTRRSASVRLDWKISPRTKWSVSASWNTFESDFKRNMMDFYMNRTVANMPSLALAYAQRPQYTVSTQNIRSGMNAAGTADTGYVRTVVDDLKKNATAHTYTTMFEDMLTNGGVLRVELYHSRSENKYSDISIGRFGEAFGRISNVYFFTDQPRLVSPSWVVAKNGLPIDLGDITNYYVNTAYGMPRTAFETRYGGSISFTQKLPFALSTSIKIGANWDRANRDMERRYLIGNSTLIAAGNAAGMLSVVDEVASAAPAVLGFPGNIAYVDNKKLYAAFSDTFTHGGSSGDFFASFLEDKTAAYARIDFKPGENWLIVAGARHEDIKGRNRNKLVEPDLITSGRDVREARGSFNARDLFCSLNVKYTPSRNHVWRAAATQSMGLPDYIDLLPEGLDDKRDTTNGRNYVMISNPDLEPYKVTNFDISYEYHYRNTGVITVSLFRKEFRNYIVEFTEAMTWGRAGELGLVAKQDPGDSASDDVFVYGNIDDYDVKYKYNVKDKGCYNGIEFAIGEQFTYLPKPFNTLGAQANITLIDVAPIKTSQVFIEDDPAQNAAIIDQAKRALEIHAMPIQANLAINWRYNKMSFLLTVNHIGRTLRDTARQEIKYSNLPVQYMNTLTRTEAQTVVNLRMEYRWKRQFTPYVQFRNLFNAKTKQTINGWLLYENQGAWPVFEFGIRGRF